jgi:hypothetical protein
MQAFVGESSAERNDAAPSVGVRDMVELRCVPCINMLSFTVRIFVM